MNNVLETCSKHCSGCGLCVSVCPVHAISMECNNGAFRPSVSDDCIDCGKCIKYCPNLSLESYTYQDFKYYYWGHSTNEPLRMEAASGGITSELLAWLTERRYVDYVVTADEYHDNQNAGYCLLNDHSIFDKAGSNYCPINMGTMLEEIKKREGTCAIVCLPCLARGIRILCQQDKTLNKKIKFIITLLCNHVPTYHATEYIKKKHNLLHADKIKYRGRGWFGYLRMFRKIDSGYSQYFQSAFTDYFATGFSKYFWQNACIECTDHFGKYADIAMGDADFVKYRSNTDNMGETMCFINNPTIHAILLEMRTEGRITLSQDFSHEELYQIYEPLCKSNRADTQNLRQDYNNIIRKEKLICILRKFHIGWLLRFSARCKAVFRSRK